MVCSCVLRELETLFGAPRCSFTYEQLVAGLKKIGIDHVYDPAYASHASDNHAADMLDKALSKKNRKCLILTRDYAVKNFLKANYPELEKQFLFYDSMQKVFGDYMHEHFPGVKLYNVTCRNSNAAEAVDEGTVDYFINTRELYRIFLRTGVNPALRNGELPEVLCEMPKCQRYEKLLHAGRWELSGEASELVFTENGKEYKALICHNPSQFKKAVSRMDDYDVISVLA